MNDEHWFWNIHTLTRFLFYWVIRFDGFGDLGLVLVRRINKTNSCYFFLCVHFHFLFHFGPHLVIHRNRIWQPKHINSLCDTHWNAEEGNFDGLRFMLSFQSAWKRINNNETLPHDRLFFSNEKYTRFVIFFHEHNKVRMV